MNAQKVTPIGAAVISIELTLFAESLAVLLRQIGRFSQVHMLPAVPAPADFPKVPAGTRVFIFTDGKGGNPRERVPGRTPSVVIFIGHIRNFSQVDEALLLKPDGLLNLTDTMEELLHCLSAVEDGRQYLSASLTRFLTARHDRLFRLDFTPKEREVLRHALRGKNIARTAEALRLSRHTVITHRRNMMVKANCNSITELLAIAVAEGLISY